MLERALPIQHPEITVGKEHEARRPVSARAILHAFAARFARVLRALGSFFAAGGPPS